MIVDCKYVKLEDIATDSADGPFGSNLKKEHYTDKPEVRIIQLSNIKDDGWCEDNTKYTTFEHLKNISRSEVHPGDIVIAKMMPAGRAILCPSHESKFVLSSDAVRFSLKKEIYNSYVVYALNSPYFRNQVYENVTGIGRVRTSLTKLRKYQIPLPPLPEQQRIVEHLDSAFAKIDALKANAEKMVEESKALFASALREAMIPKEGWEEKKLKEIADYSIGLTYKPSDVCHNGTVVLRSSNIQDDKLDLQDIVRVSCKVKDSLYAKEGDILMCSRNGSARLVGKVAIIPKTDEQMTYGTFMMLIKSRLNKFLFYYFKSDLFRDQIKHGEANMINQITRYMLDDVILFCPPLPDQQSIVSHLDDLSAKVHQLEANYKKVSEECDALKQAILRETFE